MNNLISHENSKKLIELAIVQKQAQRYANSAKGIMEQKTKEFLEKKIGADTLNTDLKSLMTKLQNNQQRVKNQQYLTQEEYDSLIADTEAIKTRLGYYGRYVNKYAPDQKDVISSVQEQIKSFDDAVGVLGEQKKAYGEFKSADEWNESIQAQKEQQAKETKYLNYDFEAAEKEYEAALGRRKEHKRLCDVVAAWEHLQGDRVLAEKKGYSSDDVNAGLEDAKARLEAFEQNYDSYEPENLQREINEAKKFQEYYNIMSVMDANDFESGSVVSGGYNLYDMSSNGSKEVTHGIINGKIAAIGSYGDKYVYNTQLTDDEKKVYNYLYNKDQKEGTDNATKFVDFMWDTVKQREGVRRNEVLQNLMPDNWFGEVIEVPVNFVAGLYSGVKNSIPNLIAGITNTEKETGVDEYFVSALRQDSNPVSKALLDVGQSTGNMLPSILISSALSMAGMPQAWAGAIASVEMGFQARGSAFSEALRMGYSKEQASTYATFNGALEGSLQYALGGVAKLSGNVIASRIPGLANGIAGIQKGGLRFLANWGVSMVSEAFEEGLQAFLDPYVRQLTLGEKADVDWEEVTYSALLGALSAGLLEGPSAYNSAKLPDIKSEKFKKFYDTGKGDDRLSVFENNIKEADAIWLADISKAIESNDTKKAMKLAAEAALEYEYVGEYEKRTFKTDTGLSSEGVAKYKTLEVMIKDGKLNSELIKTTVRESNSIWQAVAERNDTVANTLLQDGLSNNQIEKTLLSDKGVANAFKRLTGVDLSQYKTVSQKRNAVKVTAEAYKAFAGSDTAKQVTEILKANNTISDANARSANRTKAQKILIDAYKIAASEDQTVRNNGDRHGAAVAQAKMKLIRALQNDVRNGNVLSFASLDGSVAINNTSESTKNKAKEKMAPETKSAVASTTTVDEDVSNAFKSLSSETRGILGQVGKQGTTTEGTTRVLTEQDVINLAAQDLNRRIKAAKKIISDKTASKSEKNEAKKLLKELNAEVKKLNDFARLWKQATLEREQLRAFENEIAIEGRVKAVKKWLKKFGVDLEYELGGVWYTDEDGHLMTEEEGKKALENGRKVHRHTNNGYQSAWTVAIMSALAQGNIKVLSGGRMVTKRVGYGKGEVSPERAVDIIIGHELVHFVKTNASNESAKALYKDIIKALEGTDYDESFDLAHKSGEKTDEAQENWDNLKDLYIKAVMNDKKITKEQAEKIVTDDYIEEEIAADYMGALFSSNGIINTVNAQSNFIVRIWEWLTKLSHKYSENGLDRQKRVDVLAGKLKSIVERTYGGQEKLTAKKAEMEAKAKEEADEKKKQKEADKATAKAARDAQKSTESDESAEGEQTPAETEKGTETADNDVKMSVVGENSETADLSALELAKMELARGLSPNAVRFRRGWWQGKDGKWRYEIADNEMHFERNGLVKNPQTLEDYIQHDKLFDAYPHLRNIRVEFEDIVDGKPGRNGTYNDGKKLIILKDGRTKTETKRTLIHEIQHAVQNYEGFATGFNVGSGYIALFNQMYNKARNLIAYYKLRTPAERLKFVDDLGNRYDEKALSKMAFDMYRESYGETEARATAERLEMDEDERLLNLLQNEGVVYTPESVRSEFVDILKDMGYNETEITQMLSEDTNDVTESTESEDNRIERSKQSGVGSSRGIQNVSEVHGTAEGSPVGEAGGKNNPRRLLQGRGVKYSISPETDASYLSAVENGDIKTAQRMVDEAEKGDIKWSISPSLDSDIDSVLNGTFDASRNEVYLGETSQFMTDVIGANALSLYMPASKVYSSLVTRDEYNKKSYYAEQDNYHGIGKEDFIDILERSENPIAAFAAAPDEKGNKRLNRIVLVTDKIIKETETGEEGYAVVVEEVDTTARSEGKQIKANKAITIYPRSKLDFDISDATTDGRLLDITKKGEQLFAGRRGSNPQATIQKDVLKKNIANFWANVKWKNQKNKIYSSTATPTTTAMEDAIKNSSYYKSMQNSQNNSDGRMSTVADDAETSSQDYLEMIAETKAKKESNATLVEKLLNERGTRIEGTSVPEFLKNLIASYESEAWYGNVEKKYHELFDKVYSGKGGKVDVKTVTDMFREIATIIFDRTTENELETLVKDIHSTEINVTDTVKQSFENWNEFRTKNFGNLSIRNESGRSISEVYGEISNSYPELFPDNITDPAEQLKALASVTSELRAELKKQVYNEAQENLIEQITSDLIEGTMKLDPQILYSYKVNNRTKDYYEKRIADFKQAQAEWNEKVRERIASRSEKQKIAYDKKMTYKRLKDISKALFTPTKKHHIPEDMRNDVAAILRKIRLPETTVADIEFKRWFDSELNALEIGNELNEATVTALPPNIYNSVKNVSDFNLASFDSEQMHEFSQLLRALSSAVNQKDKLYHDSKSAEELAASAIRQIELARDINKKVNKHISGIPNWLGMSAWDPEGLFNYIGIPELTEAYRRIAEGQDAYAQTLNELAQKMGEIVNGRIPKEWREQGVEISLENGQKLTFSKAQIMSLYLLYNQADSRKRLLDPKGGIELTRKDIKQDYKSKIGKAVAKPINAFLGKFGDKKVASTVTVLGQDTTLTQNDLDKIMSDKYLDNDMKEIADKISDLLNGDITDRLNKISLEIDGYKRFTVDSYFPMMVSDANKKLDFDGLLQQQFEALMTGKSFTFDRTGSTGVKLVVDDIFNVMDRHILGVSQYVGYEKALRDFMKIYTGRYGNSQLKHELSKRLGSGVTDGIDNFIKGVQGRQMQTGDEQLITEKLFSNYKAAAVALNLSVVAKQPTAILRAMPEFSIKGIKAMGLGSLNAAKDIAKTIASPKDYFKLEANREAVEEMLAHSGLAKMKKWGFSENATAKSVGQLYDDNSLDWRTKMNDVRVFNWAEQADLITWSLIWKAARAETSSIEEATQKFNDVIRKTQVVNTATTSSPIASQSFFHKLVFAFKNEPLKTFNYTRAAVQDFVRGKEGSGKHLTTVLAMNALNTAIVAAITTAFSMMRDDEDDDLDQFWSKWYDNAKWDVFSTMTIGTGDILEAINAAENNRTVERADLVVLTDAIQLANRISSGKYESSGKSWVQMMYDASNVVSSITGLPIRTVLRSLKTTANNVLAMADDPYWDYQWEKVFYNVDSSASQKRFSEILTEALDKDYTTYIKIKNDLVKHGYGQSRIDSAVKNSDRFVKAWNEGANAFSAELTKAQKYDKMFTSDYVISQMKSKRNSLVTEVYNAMLNGDDKLIKNKTDELLAFRNPDTKRLTTQKELDKLIKAKLESAVKKDVNDILVAGYGTPQYQANVEELLDKYRNFDMIDEKYIDKLARSMN